MNTEYILGSPAVPELGLLISHADAFMNTEYILGSPVVPELALVGGETNVAAAVNISPNVS